MSPPPNLILPGGLQSLTDLEALENFRDAFFLRQGQSWTLELFKKEVATERNVRHQSEGLTLVLLEAVFIDKYSSDYFDGNDELAKSVIGTADLLPTLSTVAWLTVKDSMSPALANNSIMFDQLVKNGKNKADAGFSTYFGGMNYLSCDPARSIFSPPAYMIDLLRLMRGYFDEAFMDEFRKRRRPDIFATPLSPSNTFDTLPLLDLIIETLSMLLGASNPKSEDLHKVLSETKFPFNLPFNQSLVNIRANLALEKGPDITLAELMHRANEDSPLTSYRPEGRHVHEMLALSPEEAELLETEASTAEEVMAFYGYSKVSKVGDGLKFVEDLSNAKTFIGKTGLTRGELKNLIEGGLSPEQLAAGESRKFFINDVSDGKPPMTVKTQLQKPISVELKFHEHNDSKQISFLPSDTVERAIRVVKENFFVAGLELDFELDVELDIEFNVELDVGLDVSEGSRWKVLESKKTLSEALWGGKGLEFERTEAMPVFVRWKEDATPAMPGQFESYFKKDAKWAEQIDLVELHDGIENLSWQKLDRIHRFIRLSRKAEMSFEQLDWLIGSRQNFSVGKRLSGRVDPTATMTHAPFFDGINDFISVNMDNIYRPQTIEFWVKPMKSESQGIMSFGAVWSLFLDEDGKLVLWFNKKVFGFGDNPLPLRRFTHVALVFSANETGKESVTAFANGKKLGTTIEEEADVVQPERLLIDEKEVFLIGKDFKGCLQEIRIWDTERYVRGTRSEALIADMNVRLFGDANNDLKHCWPLDRTYGGFVWDIVGGADGRVGGGIHARSPRWILSDAPVDIQQVPGMMFDGDRLLSGEALYHPSIDTFKDSLSIEVLVTLTDIESMKSNTSATIFSNTVSDGTQIELSISKDGTAIFSVSVENSYENETKLENNKMYLLHGSILENGELDLKISSPRSSRTFSIAKKNAKKNNMSATEQAAKEDTPQGIVRIGCGFRGVIHRLVVSCDPPAGGFVLQETPQDPKNIVADWNMSNDGSRDNVQVWDASGYGNTLIGGKLLRELRLDTSLSCDLGTPFAFAMEAKSVIKISNKGNLGLARFPAFTIGLWFFPGLKSTDTEVIFAQGDDDVGFLCSISNHELLVSSWIRTLEEAPGGSPYTSHTIAKFTLKADCWHHLGVSLTDPHSGGSTPIRVTVDCRSNETGFWVDEPIPQTAVEEEDAHDYTSWLSPTEPIYLGGVLDLFDRRIVLADNTDVAHKTLADHFFHGRLADFRIWPSALTLEELRCARKLSSLASSSSLTPLLTVPLGKQDIDISSAHTNSELESYNVVLLAIQEDDRTTSAPLYSGPHGFEALLFREKTVLTTSSIASSFAFYEKSEDWGKDYKVNGRFRVSDPSGGLAIIASTIALVWVPDSEVTKREASFRVTSRDDLSGSSDKAVDVLKLTTSEVVENQWFRFSIHVEQTGQGNGLGKIQAKVWRQGESEPALNEIDFQEEADEIRVMDSGFEIFAITDEPKEEWLPQHTFGVWTFGPGEKQFDDLVVYDTNTNPETYLLKEGFEKGSDNFMQDWAQVQFVAIAGASQTVKLPAKEFLIGTRSYVPNTLQLVQAVVPKTTPTFPSSDYKYAGRMWIPEGQLEAGVAFYIDISAKTKETVFYTLGLSSNKRHFELSRVSPGLGFNRTSLARSHSIDERAAWYNFEVTVSTGSNGEIQINAAVWGTQSLSKLLLSAADRGPDRLFSGTVGCYSNTDGARFADLVVLEDLSQNGALEFNSTTDAGTIDAIKSSTVGLSESTRLLVWTSTLRGGASMRLEGQFRLASGADQSMGVIFSRGEQQSANYFGVEIDTDGVHLIDVHMKKHRGRGRHSPGGHGDDELYFHEHDIVKADQWYKFVVEVIPSDYSTMLSNDGNLVTTTMSEGEELVWQSGSCGDRKKKYFLAVNRRHNRLVIYGYEDKQSSNISVHWSNQLETSVDDSNACSSPMPELDDLLSTDNFFGVGEIIASNSGEFSLQQMNDGNLVLSSSQGVIWESGGWARRRSPKRSSPDQNVTLSIKIWPIASVEPQDQACAFSVSDNKKEETREFGIVSKGSGNEIRNISALNVHRVLDDGKRTPTTWAKTYVDHSLKPSTALKLDESTDGMKSWLVPIDQSSIASDNADDFDFNGSDGSCNKYLFASLRKSWLVPIDQSHIASVNADEFEFGRSSKSLSAKGWTWQAMICLPLLKDMSILELVGENGTRAFLEINEHGIISLRWSSSSANIETTGDHPAQFKASERRLVTLIAREDRSGVSINLFIAGEEVFADKSELARDIVRASTIYIGKEPAFEGSIGQMLLWSKPLDAATIARFQGYTFQAIVSVHSDQIQCQWPAVFPDNNPFSIGGTESRFQAFPVIEAFPDTHHPRSELSYRSRPAVLLDHSTSLSVKSGFGNNHFRQRSIEIWFIVDNVNASGKQLLISEGGVSGTEGHSGLEITVENGYLYFGADLKAKVVSGHCYQAAVAIDSSREERHGAIAAFLDGMLVGTMAGSVSSPPAEVTIGGGLFSGRVLSVRTLAKVVSEKDLVLASDKDRASNDLSNFREMLLPAVPLDQHKSLSVKSGFNKYHLQRSIEMRFIVDDVNASGKQLLISENGLSGTGGHSGLEITIESGYLYFGADMKKKTKVVSGHCYQVAVAIDSSRENLIAAFLDGTLVEEMVDISVSSTPPKEVTIGGGSFSGRVLSVRTLAKAVSEEDLMLEGDKDRALNDLSDFREMLDSSSSTNGWSGREKVSRSASQSAAGGEINLDVLKRVSTARWLDDQDKLPMSEGIFLLGHISNSEIDRVFNAGIVSEERWDPLEVSIPWKPTDKSIEACGVRLQLAVSLQMSSQDLDDLLTALDIDLNQTLTVDGVFLSRLLRFSMLVDLLGIDKMDVKALLQVTQSDPDLPGDIIFLARLVDWLQDERGISPSSLSQFLSQKTETKETRVSERRKMIAAFADFVTDKSVAYTLVESSFVSEGIDEKRSLGIFKKIAVFHHNFDNGTSKGASAVIPALRGFQADNELFPERKILREDMGWQEIFCPTSGNGLLDEFAAEDLANEMKRFEILKTDDVQIKKKADEIIGALKTKGLFGPQARSKTSFDLSALQCLLDSEEFWTVILPRLIRGWARMKEHIEAIVVDCRAALDAVLSAGIAEIFEMDDEISTAIDLDTSEVAIVQELSDIVYNEKEATECLILRISKIENVAELANALELNIQEVRLLLEFPEEAFGIQDLQKTTFENLVSVMIYTDVRDFMAASTDGATDKLLDLLRKGLQEKDLELVGLDLEDAAEIFEGDTTSFGLSKLWMATRVLDLTRRTGAPLEAVLRLGRLEGHESFASLNTLATFVGSAVMSIIEGSKSSKETLYEATAVPLRDALLAVVTENYRDQLESVTVVDASPPISEFLLFDVLTGPKVLVSRVQQAIASIQYLIHRCLLGLEDSPKKKTIRNGCRDDVETHWQSWMKNYRVWEATRKVFVYPENFLEPDLRKNKTPEFESFVSAASDGGDPEATDRAINGYVEELLELAKLRIIGSAFKHVNSSINSDAEERLVLVGKKKVLPSDIYIREHIRRQGAGSWGAWEKLDAPVAARFISPVYAFGRLHLFWMKELPEMEEVYILTPKRLQELPKTFKSGRPLTVEDLGGSAKDSIGAQTVTNASFKAIGLDDDGKEKFEFEFDFLSNFWLSVQENLRKIPATRDAEEKRSKYGEPYFVISKKYVDNLFKHEDIIQTYATHYISEIKVGVSKTFTKASIYYDDYPEYLDEIRRQYKLFFEGTTYPPSKEGCAKAFAKKISLQVMHQERSGDGMWSPADSIVSVNKFFYDDFELPDGSKAYREVLDPINQILRVASGKTLAEGITNDKIIDTITPEKDPFVLDVTQLESSKGMALAEKAGVIDGPYVVWDTLVHITKVSAIPFKDRVRGDEKVGDAGKRIHPQPQRSYLYEWRDEDEKVCASLCLEQIITTSYGFESDPSVGKFKSGQEEEVLKFVENRSKAKVSETTYAELQQHVGLVAKKYRSDFINTKFEELAAIDEAEAEEEWILSQKEPVKPFKFESRRALTSEFESRRARVLNLIVQDHWKELLEILWKPTLFNVEPDRVDVVAELGEERIVEKLSISTSKPSWRPLKMSFDPEKMKVEVEGMEFEFDLKIDVAVLKPRLGRHAAGEITQTVEVLMSETRIWHSENGIPPHVLFGGPRPFMRFSLPDPTDDGVLKVIRDSLMTDYRENDLSFVKATELTFQRMAFQVVPDVKRERIFIWANDMIITMDSGGTKSEFNIDLLPKVFPSLNPEDNNKFSHMRLVSEADGSKFGKIVHIKSKDKPDFFHNSGNTDLGLNLTSKPSKISAWPIVITSSDETTPSLQKISLEKSFLMPIGNLREGWILDTTDERFLIMPSITPPAPLLGPDSKGPSEKFCCVRLGSIAISAMVEKASSSVRDLYHPKAQLDLQESKTGLKFITEASNNIWKTATLPDIKSNLDFNGPNKVYYREIFFEIPLYLATQLNSGGNYQAAQEWMHRVFNPQLASQHQVHVASSTTIADDVIIDVKVDSWVYRPFRDLIHTPIEARVIDKEAIAALKDNMLDPHAIADTRIVAHMKAFLFRYIDNLLDWGDSLFQMDTREAINEAMIAYMRCFAILGQRPYVIPEHGEFELQIHTANQMLPVKKKFRQPEEQNYHPPEKENTDFFIPGWKNRSFVQQELAESLSILDLADSLENPAMLGKFFCVPENKQLLTYWDRVDDRLDKIRRSLNFSGTFRQLALFQPPIDPRALIAAGGAAGVLSTLPIPHYRYGYLVEIAKEMIQTTIAFGGQLLAAFEAKDAEELAAREIDMSIALNIVDQSIQEAAVMAAEYEIEQVEVSKRSLLIRIVTNASVLGLQYAYSENQRLIDAKERLTQSADRSKLMLLVATGNSLSNTIGARSKLILDAEANKVKEAEKAARKKKKAENAPRPNIGILERQGAASVGRSMKTESTSHYKKTIKSKKKGASYQVAGAGTAASAAVSRAFPEIETGTAGLGPLVALKYGATAISGALEIVGTVLAFKSAAAEAIAGKAELEFNMQANTKSLESEKRALERDLECMDSQLAAAECNLKIALAEQQLASIQQEQLNQIRGFLSSKFTNNDLYAWHVRRLLKLLKISYDQALSAAKMAERALQYELPTDKKFISSTWTGGRRGLLAAEMLLTDVTRMTLFNLNNDSRFQEIERKISLRNQADKKEAFLNLLDPEADKALQMEFDLTEEMFDKDFPGHYFRVIKTVSLSIIPASGKSVDLRRQCPRLTLIQNGNKVLTTASPDGVRHLLGISSQGAEVEPNVIRMDWRARQMMTMSRWEDDNGMFTTNWLFDDRYFYFEGTGAVSSWTLELGREFEEDVKLADILGDDGDIIMTVKYTSNVDRGGFRDDVTNLVKGLGKGP